MTRLQESLWIEQVSVRKHELDSMQVSKSPWRLDLYQVKWLRPLLQGRFPQLAVRSLTFGGFVFTILAGLMGARVGGHNFAIIMVWIAWWTALKFVFIPLGGRSWCSICPIPLPGEWLQQGGILSAGVKHAGFNLRWPKKLKNSWLQSASFMLVGMFSAVTLTDPRLTGWILLGILLLATGLSLVYERRPFCSSLCPIGGLSGLYAQVAPLEVRIADKDICSRHAVKSCYQACPWGLYPVALADNSACGMCLECLRACPHDNLGLNLRSFGTDLHKPVTRARLDESFMALVMLASVVAFTAVFTGPWGWLKAAAYAIGSRSWFGYAFGYLGLTLGLSGLFALAVWASQKFTPSIKNLKLSIATQARALIPLGLMAWIAFTVSFALPKLNTILGVLNDPFSWGWKLLGRADFSQGLQIDTQSRMIQLVLMLVGMFGSSSLAVKLTRRQGKIHLPESFPVLAFSLLITLSMLWLLLG